MNQYVILLVDQIKLIGMNIDNTLITFVNDR